jgi:hypothetical protein
MQIHEDDMFRPYVPRGKGLYKTSVGTHTLCKNCEALNYKANKYFKVDAPTTDQQSFLDKVAEVYKQLQGRGGEPTGAYARYVLGVHGTDHDAIRRRSDDDLLAAVLGTPCAVTVTPETSQVMLETTPVDYFIGLLETRQFSDTETAWRHYDEIKEQVDQYGRREYIYRLLDIWEEEEDK